MNAESVAKPIVHLVLLILLRDLMFRHALMTPFIVLIYKNRCAQMGQLSTGVKCAEPLRRTN